RVGLGIHQAGIPVAGAAPDAGTLFPVLLIEPHADRQVERPVADPDQIVMQFLDARFMADGLVAVRRAGRRLRRVLASLSVHLIEVLRLGVIRLQLLVRDRPGRRDATVVLDLAEILLAEPQQHCPVDFGLAAGVVWDAGMENPHILVFPTDISSVLVVYEDGAGIPALLLARE